MSFVKKKYIQLDTHIVRFDAQQMMQGSKQPLGATVEEDDYADEGLETLSKGYHRFTPWSDEWED